MRAPLHERYAALTGEGRAVASDHEPHSRQQPSAGFGASAARVHPEASHGDTALQFARGQRPDLLVLDWNMPGRDGLEVCRALRADPDPQLRQVPVVLLTAHEEAEDTAAGSAAGVTDYVTKPSKSTHVRSRVHAWLVRSRRPGES